MEFQVRAILCTPCHRQESARRCPWQVVLLSAGPSFGATAQGTGGVVPIVRKVLVTIKGKCRLLGRLPLKLDRVNEVSFIAASHQIDVTRCLSLLLLWVTPPVPDMLATPLGVLGGFWPS